MTKTVTLTEAVLKVEGLAGQNTIVQSLGSSAIWVSPADGVDAGADGVAEIPAGSAMNIYGTHGTIFLKGTGKVQLTGTDYSELNCAPVTGGAGGSGSSGGSDNSGGSGLTKDDIDGLFGESPGGGGITKDDIDGLFGEGSGGGSSDGGGSSGITKGDIDGLF